MWPSLNKALYCGAGEVAVLSKTKWTSQFGISEKVCVYTVAGEGGGHGIMFTTQQTSQGSLEVCQNLNPALTRWNLEISFLRVLAE